MADSNRGTGGYWWTSVWPLFAVSVLVGLVAGGAVVIVGGVGSIIAGTVLARRFAAHPETTFGAAYTRGVVPIAVVVAVMTFLLGFGETSEVLEARGWERSSANALAAAMTLGKGAFSAILLCAPWALAVSSKARKLRASAVPSP